jgi:hypothetical protein
MTLRDRPAWTLRGTLLLTATVSVLGCALTLVLPDTSVSAWKI